MANIDEALKSFILPGTHFVPCDAILLCDSMGQFISSKVIKTECEFFKGCKIKHLTQKLLYIYISEYKCIALIIGTCDISSKEVWISALRNGKVPEHKPKPIAQIVVDYSELLRTISSLNSEATVLVTSIIPRPFDFEYNRQYLKELNHEIGELVNIKPSKYKFLNTAKQFIKCGEIKENMFIEDKIHLSPVGNKSLTDMLNGRIGQIISIG